MKIGLKKIVLVLAVLVIAGGSFAFTNSRYFEITKNLDLFASLFKELNSYYVDDIDPEELMKKGIDAMLESLDPYTVYYPEEDIEGFRMQTTGKYGGIGALIRKSGDHVIISEPYEGFPAFNAGLRAGDKIEKVGGASMVGKSTDEVSKILRGKPGTSIEVVISRPRSKDFITKTLTREEIKVGNVPYYGMINEQTGYIKLTNFTNDCSKEVGEALKTLKSENDLKGLILDLRGNPGGLLQEAVNVANLFIDKGALIVNTKGKVDEWEKVWRTRNAPIDSEIPLVVLTSRGSASASEIVSGVLQDYDRAIVIGQKTFGKGLVQSTKDVGYNSKLKLTTAKYYLPSKRCIQAIDYSGKYKDGSDKIPDSLRTAYKTTNGRVVYDAGGIDPEIIVESERISHITASLLSNQLIFEYATEYQLQNPQIASAREFTISDQEFDEFVNYLKDKEYDYTSQSERLLEDLKKSAEEEKYYAAIETNLQELSEQIKHDKYKDLFKFKSEIKRYLEDEIVARYYFRRGRLESTIDEDKFVEQAMDVLNNTAEYNKLLAKSN